MTKQMILDYLFTHKNEFINKYDIERIGLFGSYAREEATAKSDIDIFVKMKPNLFKVIGLKQEIEEALLRSVDIVREHSHLKSHLKTMIEKDITYV